MILDLEKAARRERAASLVMRAFDHHQSLAKWGDAGFDESKVNRDEDGKFAPKGTTAHKPSKAELQAAKEAFLADYRESRGLGYDAMAGRAEAAGGASGGKEAKPKTVNWKKMSQTKRSRAPKAAKDIIEIPKDPYRKKRELVIGGEMRPKDAPSRDMILGRRAYAWKAKVIAGDDVEVFKPDFSGRVNALVVGFDNDGNLLVRRRFSQNRPSNRTVKVSPKNVTKHFPLKETGRKVTLTVGDNVSYSLPRRKKPVNGRILGFTKDGQVKVRRAAPKSASGSYLDEVIHPRDISNVFAVKFEMFNDLMKWGAAGFDESKVKRDEKGRFADKPVDETYRGKLESEGEMLAGNIAGGIVAEGGSRYLKHLKDKSKRATTRAGRFAARFVPGGTVSRGAALALPTIVADVGARATGQDAGRYFDIKLLGDRKAAQAEAKRRSMPEDEIRDRHMGAGETVGLLSGNMAGTIVGAKRGSMIGSRIGGRRGALIGGLVGAGLGGYLGETAGVKLGREYDRRKQAQKIAAAAYDRHLAKWGSVGFDESKIRRHPKGHKQGGKFAPKHGVGASAANEAAGVAGATAAEAAYRGVRAGLGSTIAAGAGRLLQEAPRFIPGGAVGRAALATGASIAADAGVRRALGWKSEDEDDDPNSIFTSREKQYGMIGESGGAIAGSVAGAMVGAKAGSIFGPPGMLAGAILGGGIASYAGERGGRSLGGYYGRKEDLRRKQAQKFVAAIYDLHKSEPARKQGALVHVDAHTRKLPDGTEVQVKAHTRGAGSGSRPSGASGGVANRHVKAALSIGKNFLKDQARLAGQMAKDSQLRQRVFTAVSAGSDLVEAIIGNYDPVRSQQVGELVDAAIEVAEFYRNMHKDKIGLYSRYARRLARRVLMRKAAWPSPKQQDAYNRLLALGEADPEGVEFFVALMTLLDRDDLVRLFKLERKRRSGAISEAEEQEMLDIMARFHDRYHGRE